MAIVIKRADVTPTREGVVAIPTTFTCVECERVFDMFDETDAEEWHYGHDCEPMDDAVSLSVGGTDHGTVR